MKPPILNREFFKDYLTQLERDDPAEANRIKENAYFSVRLQEMCEMTTEDQVAFSHIKRDDPERYRDILKLARMGAEQETDEQLAIRISDPKLANLTDRVELDRLKVADPARHQHILKLASAATRPPQRERCPRWCAFAHAGVAMLVGGTLFCWYEGELWATIIVIPLAFWSWFNLKMGLFASQEKLDNMFNAGRRPPKLPPG